MGEVFRRVVLKPPGLSDTDSTALAQRLAADVRLQQDLTSSSPHVLRFMSDLQETETSFFVEHEPASPFGEAIFDPDAAFPTEGGPDESAAFVERLLDWAVALLDTLRGAHDRPGDRPVVHGGLCGGALLLTPDRCGKVSDFGFAASICAALGVEAYVNLAVGPRMDGPPDQLGTGVWEVLPPTKERDDRICGFIDPDKYTNQTHGTFEAGSDIVAVGFLLHLMDLHRHPYLGDPRDHLLAETAESMAFNLYDGARRKTLRGSDDPRVKVWCDMVAQMLSNLPHERPSAAKAAAAFAQVGVKPFSRETGQKKELAGIVNLLKKSMWVEALQRAQALAADPASDEIAALGNACQSFAQINVSLDQASSLLGSDDLASVRQLLDSLPDWPNLAGLPDLSNLRSQAAQKLEDINTVVQVNLAAQEELDRIEAEHTAAEAIDLVSAKTAQIEEVRADVRSLSDRLEKLPENQHLQPALRARRETARAVLTSTKQKVDDELERRMRAEAAARDWLTRIRVALDDGNPDKAETILEQPPAIDPVPPEIAAERRVLEAQLGELKAAIKWLDELREAVKAAETDRGNLETAQRIHREKPPVSHWPAGWQQEVDELARRLAKVEAKVADYANAHLWIDAIRPLVSAKDWSGANTKLNAKPSLTHWPEDVLRDESGLRAEIGEHLEEQERIVLWLKSSDEAAQAGDYLKALDILHRPPVPAADLPPEIQREVEKREEAYAAKLNEALTAAVHKMALAFLGNLLAKDLKSFLRPEAVQGKVDAVEWNSPNRPEQGTAKLNVRLHGVEGTPGTPVVSTPFEFEIESGAPRLKDENGLQNDLGASLKGLVQRLQQHEAASLSTPFRDGLFPKGKVEVDLRELTTRTRAAVCFLGPKVSNAIMETEIVWDPAGLAWNYADPAALVQRAVQTATKGLPKLVLDKLVEGSEVVREYSSTVRAEVDPPDLAGKTTIPVPLTLTGRLTMRVGPKGDQKLLDDFPIVCRQVGRVSIQAEPNEADAAVQQILRREQDNSRDTIETKLLREPLKNKKIKARLAASTKATRQGQVEAVEFVLKPKGGEKLTLRADWNLDQFEFELTEEARGVLQDLLDNPPTVKPIAPWVKYAAVPSVVVVLGLVGAFATGIFTSESMPEPPPNDGGNGPRIIAITEQPSDTAVCVGQTAEFRVEATGTIDTYRWRSSDEVLPTENHSALVLSNVAMDDAGQYAADIIGPSGEVSSTPAELTVLPNVAITDQPTGANSVVGEVVTFTVSATGSDLTYQWRKDGADIPGESGESLILRGVTLLAAGEFDVVIRSTCGEVSSDKALLAVAEHRISSAQVVQEIRGYLAQSEFLEPLVTELVADAADLSVTPPSLAYRLPGLAEPDRSATLVGPSAADEWELSEEEATRIRREVDELDRLLGDPQTAGDLSGTVRDIARDRFSEYLLPEALISAGIEGGWELAGDRQSWVGTGTAVVSLDGREAFTLTNIGLAAQDGRVSADLDNGIESQVDAGLTQTLLAVQGVALRSWREDLDQRQPPDGSNVARPPDDGNTLRKTVEVRITNPVLVDRAYSASWIPERLVFEPAYDWGEIFETYHQVYNIVQALNGRHDGTERITQVLPPACQFVEVGEPTPRQITLVAAPPWATDEQAANPGTLNPSDRIEIPVPIGPVEEVLPDFEPPPYWSLLETYSAIKAHPYVTGSDDDPGQMWPSPWDVQTLPPRLKNIAEAQLSFLAPHLTIVGRPNLEANARPPTLQLSLEGGWALRDAPPGVDPESLEASVRSLANDQALAYSLRLTTTSGEPAWNWPDEDAPDAGQESTVEAFQYFDRLLREFPDRAQVERELEGHFVSQPTELTEADAHALLQRIWGAKLGPGAGRAETAESFDALSRRLLGVRRFSEKSRRIEPTVFIEYFWGPRFTYAIVFSARPEEGVIEGPYLIRVCPNQALATEDTLGKVFFDQVFQYVSQACRAKAFEPFEGNLGIMVAADERMSLFPTSLEQLSFTPQESYLLKYGVAASDRGEDLRWNTLSALRELRDERKEKCDYRLVDTLSQPAKGWSRAAIPTREARLRAALAFEEAVAGAGDSP